MTFVEAKRFIVLSLLTLFALPPLSVSAKDLAGDTKQLMIFPQGIVGVFADAENISGGPIDLRDVHLIVRSGGQTQDIPYANKSVSSSGCLLRIREDGTHVSQSGERNCQALLSRASRSLLAALAQCGEKNQNIDREVRYLFIDFSVPNRQSCLYKPKPRVLSIEGRQEYVVANQNEVAGFGFISAKRLFQCAIGNEISYYTTAAGGKRSDDGDLKASISEKKWTHRYLILTPGYRSCYGQVAKVDFADGDSNIVFINDGTMLMTGAVSIFRVTAKDGELVVGDPRIKVLNEGEFASTLQKEGSENCREWLTNSSCPWQEELGISLSGDKMNDEKSRFRKIVRLFDKKIISVYFSKIVRGLK